MVLADSCCGLSLAMRSSSASYYECVPNRACQEGRKSWLSLIGFRKSICACPCIIAPLVRSCPPAPDTNQPILTKRCKYRPDFTPFVSIYQFGVNNACYFTSFCRNHSYLLLLLERQEIHSPGQTDIRISLFVDKSTIWIAVGTERLAEYRMDT